MPFTAKDTDLYRRDEKFGHKLLTKEERTRLLQPYLPTPPSRSPSRRHSRRRDGGSRFQVRRFIRAQLNVFFFTIIHTIFSLYIRIRQAYHAVRDQVYSIMYYHHRTPEIIERDVKDLMRLPKHLSVILKLEDDGRGGAELERLVNEVADLAAWCASAGIPMLSVYEKTGILKSYLPETHRAVSQKLAAYFGRVHPALTLRAPHVPSIESAPSTRERGREDTDEGHISIMLLSAEDGRDSLVDLTKTLAEMAQRSKISAADVSIDLIDAELSEGVMGEPDLLLLFSPNVELSGYPPWQIRLTEIFHVEDNQGVGYQVFLRGLRKYAQAQMRLGK
ncbi:uncharacterized protein E0L32_003582 [Thyridium curvatum]|uniref:ditrans,polycis-polyprenyl diphosphate synthase [(2E,6E)-farnesyldiphosphate specific] n=1 Tax=Thyridium curvatum TaxID=1093900 RepID=A0A507BI32_9PEZI|nr:uncharacterized protein E0L32_003582 [Thyridium curvatum]TPX16641.1 hypothetical protein E0L32_003582 [Thyridium curvatum]